MASQSSKRSSEEPHYTQGPAKRPCRAASEPLLGLLAPANAPPMTPPFTPSASSSNTPATNISSPTISMNRPASPVRPATPETPSKVADYPLPTQEIFEMSIEEIHAYMRLRGWDSDIALGDSVPFDGCPDLDYEDYEDALYQQGLGEDSDEDQ